MSNELKKQLWEDIADQGSVMVALSNNNEHSEPMHAHLDPEYLRSLWLYTTRDNRVAAGGKAMIQFVSKDHHLFACMQGQLVEETNKAMLDKFWSKGVEAWFEGGKTDKNLLMLRFDLNQAEIWTRDVSISGMFKLATGVTLQANELGQHTVV